MRHKGDVSWFHLLVGFHPSNFPLALVQQAREAAQPLCRSVAGQVEYWATLGRIVEHSGLTAQEAQTAIRGYEAAAKKAREKAPDSLEALKMRVLAVSTDGVLQANIRAIVEENRRQAVQRAAA